MIYDQKVRSILCLRCSIAPAHHIHTFSIANVTAVHYQNTIVLSPIRMVIVSQGDVSDFQHIQGVVGDFIAV